LKTRAKAEWDPLRTVVLHRPGIEVFFGLLEPYASLYERAFSRYEARMEHARLEHILNQEFKIEVLRLKDKLLQEADRRPEVRERLIRDARNLLRFEGNEAQIRQAWNEFEVNSRILDSGHFFNIMLLNPHIDLKKGRGARAVRLHITEDVPLVNLYFMRDQQATTDRGIVLSRMSKPQRQRETAITGFLWETLEAEIAHRMKGPATFEGGDFIPMKDFALVGIGDRTNRAGVEQMLSHGLGFDEVGVVHQPAHPLIPGNTPDTMVDMHLDTYFNVASSGVVVGSEILLKNATVEVFQREGEGIYRPTRTRTTLHQFITEKGFDIINITTLEQMSYASNFLCIRDSTIVAVEVDRVVPKVLENLSREAKTDPRRYGQILSQAQKDYRDLRNEGQFFPHKKEVYQHGIDAYPIMLENLTGGYGGAHCMTCVLRRG
jgi:arginine deiminase